MITGNTNQRQVMKARQLAMSGGGASSMLPMLAMAKGGKMNPAMLSILMSRGRGGSNNFLPYLLMAEGGMGEGMLPIMALMGNQGGASGGAGGSNNMLNMMLFGGMLN